MLPLKTLDASPKNVDDSPKNLDGSSKNVDVSLKNLDDGSKDDKKTIPPLEEPRAHGFPGCKILDVSF